MTGQLRRELWHEVDEDWKGKDEEDAKRFLFTSRSGKQKTGGGVPATTLVFFFFKSISRSNLHFFFFLHSHSGIISGRGLI